MESKELLTDKTNLDLCGKENKNENINPQEKEDNLSCKEESLLTFIRIRPFLKNENQAFKPVGISDNKKKLEVSSGERIYENEFDYIFSELDGQIEVFEMVKPYIKSSINGYNLSILAYGQTGSGKTHTMYGPNWESYFENLDNHDSTYIFTDQFTKKMGIVPRIVKELFNIVKEVNKDEIFIKVYCSFVQIYNEKIYDLLSDKDLQNRLSLREDKFSGCFAEGLTEFNVLSSENCLELVYRGEANRMIRQTRMNLYSSRSHSIFQILIENNKKINDKDLFTKAKINLCDLAGSEKIGIETTLSNIHFSELKNINLSLTCLAKVINALASKSFHIPYRDSKLTRYLQDYIGGDTKTCIICAVSPSIENIDETISTLHFASQSRKIQIKPRIKELNYSNDKTIQRLQEEVSYLKSFMQNSNKKQFLDLLREIQCLKDENERLKQNNLVKENNKLKKENESLKIRLGTNEEQEKTNNNEDKCKDFNKIGIPSGEINYSRTVISSNKSKNDNFQSLINTNHCNDEKFSDTIEQEKNKDEHKSIDNKKSVKTEEEINKCIFCLKNIPCEHFSSEEQFTEGRFTQNSAKNPDKNSEMLESQFPRSTKHRMYNLNLNDDNSKIRYGALPKFADKPTSYNKADEEKIQQKLKKTRIKQFEKIAENIKNLNPHNEFEVRIKTKNNTYKYGIDEYKYDDKNEIQDNNLSHDANNDFNSNKPKKIIKPSEKRLEMLAELEKSHAQKHKEELLKLEEQKKKLEKDTQKRIMQKLLEADNFPEENEFYYLQDKAYNRKLANPVTKFDYNRLEGNYNNNLY